MADIVIHGHRQEIKNENQGSKELIQQGTILSDSVVPERQIQIQVQVQGTSGKEGELDSSGSGLPKSPTGPVITPGGSNLAPIQL